MDADKKHGGFRNGAGRKKGTGRFSTDAPLVQIRIPADEKNAVIDFIEKRLSMRNKISVATEDIVHAYPGVAFLPHMYAPAMNVPVYASRVRAGLPSPVDDHLEDRLDLNQLLIQDEKNTFLVKVNGDSMMNAGISEGDYLVVERRQNARHGDIVLASVNQEFTVKRLYKKDNRLALIPENDHYEPIEIGSGADFALWGVITGCVKKF